MGITKLWSDFPVRQLHMRDFVADFYVEHTRHPRVAVDALQWVVQIQSISSRLKWSTHKPRFTRMCLQRLLAFIEVGIDMIMIFDGNQKPEMKRNKVTLAYSETEYTGILRALCSSLNVPVFNAPAEGEAQCAWFQTNGVVDYVFSNDTDCLLFGATRVMMYGVTTTELVSSDKYSGSEKQSGSSEDGDDSDEDYVEDDDAPEDVPDTAPDEIDSTLTKKIVNSRATERPLRIIDVADNKSFGRAEYILRGLLQGGDYDTFGIKALGYEVAKEISKKETKFAENLVKLYGCDSESRTMKHPDPQDLAQWRELMQEELKTNESKFLTTKHPSVHIPDRFPNENVLRSYLFPTIRRSHLPQTFQCPDFLNVLNVCMDALAQEKEESWRRLVILMTFPMLTAKIRLKRDNIDWFKSVSKAKYRRQDAPKSQVYSVSLKSCHLAILDLHLGPSSTEYFGLMDESKYAAFPTRRPMSAFILDESAHDIIRIKEKGRSSSMIGKYRGFGNQDISVVHKKRRTGSDITRSKNGLKNNTSLLSYFSVGKRPNEESQPIPSSAKDVKKAADTAGTLSGKRRPRLISFPEHLSSDLAPSLDALSEHFAPSDDES